MLTVNVHDAAHRTTAIDKVGLAEISPDPSNWRGLRAALRIAVLIPDWWTRLVTSSSRWTLTTYWIVLIGMGSEEIAHFICR